MKNIVFSNREDGVLDDIVKCFLPVKKKSNNNAKKKKFDCE